MGASRPEPPVCPRCEEQPKWHFSCVAKHAIEDAPVLREVHCAVCFCGTWVWRGAWSSPWER